MFNLSGFFNKIQNVFVKEFFLREKIRKIIKDKTKIDIKIENIINKDGLIILKKLNQGAKSTIFVKKLAILESFAKEEITKKIKNINFD